MSTIPAASGVNSLVYNTLVHAFGSCQKSPLLARYWQKAWKRSCVRFRGPVNTTIHGRQVVMNFGNSYPISTRLYPAFNSPLLELVHQAYLAKKATIGYVDIGAATGDSVLLLHANCVGMIGKTYCVDGDPEFFEYLRTNVSDIPNCTLRYTMLSSGGQDVGELVRIHLGTASAQGTNVGPSVTLDFAVEGDGVGTIDVLKIDVDGFDGQVLLGSKGLLTRDRPAVIFEWHPILCKQSSNNWTDHFEALMSCGYNRFLWFTKFGEFSHFMHGYDSRSVDILARLAFESKVHDDLHYDVVALHSESTISAIALADLSFARNRRSRS